MAKRKPITIDDARYERMHLSRMEKYAEQVGRIYQYALDEYAKLGASITNFNPDKLFNFKDYPQTRERLDKIINDTYGNVLTTVRTGINDEWNLSNIKNDEIVKAVLGKSRLSKAEIDKYGNRNVDALAAFQKRKDGPDRLGLSDRIWKYINDQRTEVELALDVGIGEGMPAAELARLLKKHLKDPSNLFRRVRNKRGGLVPSKAMAAYNPGTGVYRSSYMNAARVARTEINMAYREADYQRWQQLDFVVGIEIRLSNNPNHCKLCESLAGKYPKEFKFLGWHPQCRCNAISILKTQEEIDREERNKFRGNSDSSEEDSENSVSDVPHNFKEWVDINKHRDGKGKNKPFWVRDNFKEGEIKKGLKFKTKDTQKTKGSEEFELTDDIISEMNQENNMSIYGTAENFNKIIKGFDLRTFDKNITNIFAKNGMEFTMKNFRVNKDGSEVSMLYIGDKLRLERTFSIKNGLKQVHHDYFVIPKNVQGSGISKEVFRELYTQYKAIDLDIIDVFANIDVGGYTWAKYGFSASDFSDVKKIVSGAKFKISPSEFNLLTDWFNGLDKSQPVPLIELANMTFGKKVLLGTDWEGIINLKIRSQRDIFESYLGL